MNYREFNFDYSYLSLPKIFYTPAKLSAFSGPEILLLNKELSNHLNISKTYLETFIPFLASDNSNHNYFAQAYAGHQFGYFTKLGDGRAVIIGEHITNKNDRFDIQVKGSGRTAYSRNGDGKATLRAMLREYIISEAMFYLNIPTSRSLAVIKTGETVNREIFHDGAALIRVMKSHIRVGTFEYALYFGSHYDLQALTDYTIKRLYPEIAHTDNPVLSFLNKVIESQIDLMAHWLRVGFIHGVMNTDNTSISGETFDYGPCAFMNSYHPDTVYSSIDHSGRYAFANQFKIIKWNLSRFAESLLPILHKNQNNALELAQKAIDSFDKAWREKYYGTMLKKIGIKNTNVQLFALVDELLELMQNFKMDYTNTFLELSKGETLDSTLTINSDFTLWLKKWRELISDSPDFEHSKTLMKNNNPVYIPRNHIVEQTLNEAVNGNILPFKKLLGVLSNPYYYQDILTEYTKPPEPSLEYKYQTFCGT